MGALTLKHYPFELRNWESEVFLSLDPTDGFGSSVKVSIWKNQILQIEPDYDSYTQNNWLSDKGRQFFDGVLEEASFLKKKEWSKLLNDMVKTIYMFDLCSQQKSKKHFFKIIFSNLSVEILNILIMLSQNYSFVLLRKTEHTKLDIDLETMFQLNLSLNTNELTSSTICLLISTNSRYEGYSLNTKLKQRFLKGNFKCLIIGSLINLTFPVTFLGSNLSVVKNIVEGNNFICQDLKTSENPLLIYNNQLFKRNDSKNIQKTLQMLHYLNIFSKTWNGLNALNPTLSTTGVFNLKQIITFSEKDLNNFSSLYFLNITKNNLSQMKNVLKTKMAKYYCKKTWKNKTIINQNNKCMKDILSLSKKIGLKWLRRSRTDFNYFRVPQRNLFENDETYINTEGFVKRTTQMISGKENKNTWQIFKKLLKYFKTKLTFLKQNKKNKKIFFNSNHLQNFRNFLSFHFYACKVLTYLSWYLNILNKTFFLKAFNLNFKFQTKKIYNTKLKYWLYDFFIGGKDEYSLHSKILIKNSKILRSKLTIFF